MPTSPNQGTCSVILWHLVILMGMEMTNLLSVRQEKTATLLKVGAFF